MATSQDQDLHHHVSTKKTIDMSYLEFYSGIGGWSFALHEAISNMNAWLRKCDTGGSSNNSIKFFSCHCLGSYDHSDLCYKVYHHNFPDERESNCHSAKLHDRPQIKKQKVSSIQRPISIEKLTKNQLEEIKADIWMMSPPCQPHTRQHSNQQEDVSDPRSKSFLHLCDLISVMNQESLPKIILLENVIGFESVS